MTRLQEATVIERPQHSGPHPTRHLPRRVVAPTQTAPAPPSRSSIIINHVLTALVILMPLSLAIHGSIKAVAPALLFLVGLYLLASRRSVRADYRQAWPVIACAALLIVLTIGNMLVHASGTRVLDGAAHVLLYLAIAAVFAGYIDMRLVWAGFSVTVIGFGLVCVMQHFGFGDDRAHSLSGGTSTAIEFATLMTGLALMALVQLLRARSGKWTTCLHVAAVVLGAYGTLMTQSRGPLVAFVIVFIGMLALKARQSGRWRRSAVFLGLLVIGAVIAVTSLNEATVKRFSNIDQQISVAANHQVTGSLSARVEMWRTASRALWQHPLTGVGIDRFQSFMDKEVAAGRTNPAVARYNNPHNMYLGAAAAGGIPGLLVLLAMFLVPLGYFARHVFADDTATATAAWSGLAIVVLYMLCALTDSIFYRVMTQSFYFLLVLGLAVQIAHRSRRRLG